MLWLTSIGSMQNMEALVSTSSIVGCAVVLVCTTSVLLLISVGSNASASFDPVTPQLEMVGPVAAAVPPYTWLKAAMASRSPTGRFLQPRFGRCAGNECRSARPKQSLYEHKLLVDVPQH